MGVKKHFYKAGLAIAAILIVLSVVFDPLYPVDAFFTDHFYSRLNGTDRKIVIIGIDEETLSEYGNFTLWSREKLAELLDKLYEDKENSPAVVGLDFILTDHYDDAADEALIKASRGRDVVVGTNIVYRGAVMTAADGSRYYDKEHIADIEMPYPGLNEAAVSGFTNASIARDGYVRYSVNSIKVPEELRDKAGDKQDSFALAVYKLYCEKTGMKAAVPRANGRGQFQFIYSGESGEFSEVSMWAVMSGKVPSSAFKDAIVLVGAYAPGFQDSYQPASDRGRTMYGVEIHANIIQAYLQGKTMISANSVILAVITALITVLFLIFFKKRNLPLTIAVSVLIGAAYVFVGRLLSGRGLYISCAYMFIALFASDIYFVLEKYLLERIRRRHTLDVFKKYIAPQVVDELSRTGDFEVHLGGERRDIAVLFVDIRGFTSLSERLEPEEVVEILNEYLKHVTDCILGHHGTLDKFVGDAAMAVFNAPFDLDDYIYEAVGAAWDISRGAGELSKMLMERFGRTVSFGVGVNCGPAIVGNIGCDFRMDYTAIGDTVNTAARLESNAKADQVLVSSEVRKALGDRVEAVSIGEIPLKGKSNKIEVFSITAYGTGSKVQGEASGQASGQTDN